MDNENTYTYQAILDAIQTFKDEHPNTRLHFYTEGTGIPDEYAIEYWKDSGVIVVDRNWQKWLRGEKLKEEV